MDLNALRCGVILEFYPDGTYCRYLSETYTRADVREFYRSTFLDLFDDRAILSEIYGIDLGPMNETAFLQYYAGMYGFEDFDSLLDEFMGNDYVFQRKDLETGTYALESPKVLSVTRTAAAPADSIPFQVSDTTLTLEYSDGTVAYTNID